MSANLEKLTAVYTMLSLKRTNQSLLITILLSYSELNLDILALLIGTSSTLLTQVYKGESYLEVEQVVKLIQLFLIRFTDSIIFEIK